MPELPNMRLKTEPDSPKKIALKLNTISSEACLNELHSIDQAVKKRTLKRDRFEVPHNQLQSALLGSQGPSIV